MLVGMIGLCTALGIGIAVGRRLLVGGNAGTRTWSSW